MEISELVLQLYGDPRTRNFVLSLERKMDQFQGRMRYLNINKVIQILHRFCNYSSSLQEALEVGSLSQVILTYSMITVMIYCERKERPPQ